MPMRTSRILLAAALVFVGLIGASEAGQFLVVVRASATAIGGALIVVFLVRAPSRHDRLDLAVLVALLTFLLTCVTSAMPRLSLDTATSAVAYAAAFYVARDAVSDEGGRRLATTVLGLMGALIGIGYFIGWSMAWLRWAAVPGAGIPPVGLALPPAPFGHHYLVGTMAAILLPACIAVARRPVIWPVGLAGTVAGLAVVVMSGSRTVWLSIGVALIVVAGLGGYRVAVSRWRWVVGAVLAALAGAALLGAGLIQRLATTSTVEGRLEIYAASLDRWLDAPLMGHGPGTYSAQMTLAGHDELLTHGHNALVQMLVEGGLVGAAGLVLLVVAVVMAALRHRPRNTTAIAGLTVFGVAALTDNPTVFGFLVVPAMAWAALACPREPGPMVAPARWMTRLNLGLAAMAAVAVVAFLGAAWVYESAARRADVGDTKGVITALEIATGLDPGHPLYQRDLAIWRLADGAPEAARKLLERAIGANPADPAAQRAAALVAAASGDPDGLAVARSLVDLRSEDPAGLLTLAYVARQLGDEATAANGLVQALRYEPWIAASEAWQTEFGDGAEAVLQDANASWTSDPSGAEQHEQARAWLASMVGAPLDSSAVSATDAAASAVIDCRTEDALALLGPTSESQLDSGSLLIRILAARAEGEPADDYITLAGLRSPFNAFVASNEVAGTSPFAALGYDVQFYGRRAIPLPGDALLFPSAESGLSAWLRDPVAAADRGAPESGLAACR
jgi:O-antigen ligase